jgi:hypothetical protein
MEPATLPTVRGPAGNILRRGGGLMQQLIGKRLDGEWWAPDRLEIIYKGALQIEENHEGKLTLRGTELHLSSLPSGPGPRCFLGRLTAHYTYDVTLFHA